MTPQPSTPDSGTEAPPETPPPLADRQASLLYRTGLIGMCGLVVYFLFAGSVEDPVHRYQGLGMIVLALLPALLWARQPDTPFPIFPTFMATGLNSFALPLLGGHELLGNFPPDSVTRAAWAVLVFQASALAAHQLVAARPRLTPWWTTPLFDSDVHRYLRVGMGVTTVYAGISGFTGWIPYEVSSVARAVLFGVAILCTYLLARAWGAGELAVGDRLFFAAALGCHAIALISTLFLVSGVSLLVLALLGYVTGGKRLPLLPILAAFAALAVLHNGKSAMRLKYWEGTAPRPGLLELPGYFVEWVGYGLAPPETKPGEKVASRKLIERTSLLHMMTLVVDATPARQPFLGGETYAHILPQLIPRLFWPQKPVGHVSTHRLSIYYGLQDDESTLRTTIGFGVVVEAYANFGFAGLVGLGLLIGGLARVAVEWTRRAPVVSYPGLLMVLLVAWSFQIELPLSAWLSSLYQAAIAVLAVFFVLRRVLG